MKYLDALNDQQRRAVLHTGSPLLILAGAGSGKTRVITAKIAHLVDERGMDPRSILAVTFTNKAANEMKARVQGLVPEAAGVMIRTFHSFGAWLLRRSSHLVGLGSHFKIYDEDDSTALVRRVAGDRLDRSAVKRYSQLISRAKDKNLTPSDDLSAVSTAPDFDEIYRLYEERLRRTGNVDFGDLIMRVVELLREHPEVRRRVRQRFRVVLVDEYQDANTAQFLLLKELHDEDGYLCVVGDEDQSIYRFRGAEVRNILDFPEVFPGTEVIRLEQNYRSTQVILTAALRMVENNRQRLGKSLWTRQEGGSPVTLALLRNENEEARFCVRLLEDGGYENTAILYRNNYQSRAFETLFSRLHIPYRLVGSLRFADREEVKDALAYLSLLVNPRDEISFLRVVNKPSRGIGRSTLSKILDTSTGDYLEACAESRPSLPSRARAGVDSLLHALAACRKRLDTEPLAELITELIRQSGLYEHCRSRDESEGSTRSANLEELVSAAAEYGSGPAALTALLESLSLDSSVEDPYARDGRVNLITFHNTKGLEFSRVIITGLEDGLFPHHREIASGQDPDLEEERRLFYVAMTRAKESLYLTSCRMRRVFGTVQTRTPSRFLSEIPPDLLEIISTEAPAAGGAWKTGGDAWSTDAGYAGGGARATDAGYAGAGGYAEGAAAFYEGGEVHHGEYGRGVVTAKWYNGEDYLVSVRFSSGKEARFILKYSGLEPVR